MDSLSRVKKNAELRQTIENSRESELTSSVLAPYADRLNKINPELSSIDTALKQPDRLPNHGKEEGERPNIGKISDDPAFHHELLDEFLDEVKNYNLKKGYATSEDTDLNILGKVSSSTPVNDEFAVDEDQITQEIKRVIASDFAPSEANVDKPVFDKLHPDVFEETAKIKLKLEDVDKELLEMSRSVNSSSRILNVIVFILVVVLLVMLGVAVYWILSTQVI